MIIPLKKIYNSILIKDILEIRKDLLFCFVISLLLIVIIDFGATDLFAGLNIYLKLCTVIYNICLSYVSAFIFYYLVVHIKNQKDKRNLNAYISKYVFFIINQAKSTIKHLSKESKIHISNEYPNDDELSLICKEIKIHSESPLIKGITNKFIYSTWFEYLHYEGYLISNNADKVLSKIQFLDSELVKKISLVRDCQLFEVVNNLIRYPMDNIELTNFKNQVYTYLENVKELDQYYRKHLIKYFNS